MKTKNLSMYSGQAIAIVMVILVVAAILGASLYSRNLKNSKDVVDQEASDVALEQADNVIDVITSTFPLSKLSELSNLGSAEYTTFKSFVDATGNTLTPDLEAIDTWCDEEGTLDGASRLKITLSRTSNGEAIDVRVGDSRTFNLAGKAYDPATSSLSVTLNPTGSPYSVFAIKKIYHDASGNIKDYGEDDIKAYCVGTASGCQSSGTVPTPDAGSSVELVSPGAQIVIPLTQVGSYLVEEVKVIPLKGDLSVSYSLSGVDDANLSYVKVNVAVNCYGSYREKQVVFPGVESLGYPVIFDYSIYNRGVLRPS